MNLTGFKVALSTGHYNYTGGNAVEKTLTPELTEAYYRAFRDLGCDVRVVQADGPDPDSDPGDAMYQGAAGEVAEEVARWVNDDLWTADLYLETHTQAGGRGIFAIFPDASGDFDPDNAALGLAMVMAEGEAIGMPLWTDGLMSETETGVGRQGWRLAIFYATRYMRNTRRLIIEHGSHTSEEDLALLRAPGNFDRLAVAGARAALEWFGVEIDRRPELTDQQYIDYFKSIRPRRIAVMTESGIYQAWRDQIRSGKNRGPAIDNEFDLDESHVGQHFAAGIAVYDKLTGVVSWA